MRGQVVMVQLVSCVNVDTGWIWMCEVWWQYWLCTQHFLCHSWPLIGQVSSSQASHWLMPADLWWQQRRHTWAQHCHGVISSQTIITPQTQTSYICTHSNSFISRLNKPGVTGAHWVFHVSTLTFHYKAGDIAPILTLPRTPDWAWAHSISMCSPLAHPCPGRSYLISDMFCCLTKFQISQPQLHLCVNWPPAQVVMDDTLTSLQRRDVFALSVAKIVDKTNWDELRCLTSFTEKFNLLKVSPHLNLSNTKWRRTQCSPYPRPILLGPNIQDITLTKVYYIGNR